MYLRLPACFWTKLRKCGKIVLPITTPVMYIIDCNKELCIALGSLVVALHNCWDMTLI